ncbi:MAG: DUF1156 domain-containing protein [Chloroflexi bacterium]|nr:DUF1156 domain-containing protein [Chloroflexota bacterium]
MDSVHEKNVRHGHISTLHIWPARRPLAACRAALIATLLPDPGDPEERKKLLERLGGRVVEVVKRKKMPSGKVEEVVTEETVGGILHWGRESGPDLDWFRAKIREAYGGRAPRVLDPFAGGGAIPLEAMRLGCEATAMDINPVAWFILKCTLEYPQKLAGQKRPLPDFVLADREFMEAFLEAQGLKGAALRTQLDRLGTGEAQQVMPGVGAQGVPLEADLAWHVRAWGRWVLRRARAELEPFYPVVDGKPTVAYLWARTVTCKNPQCGATVPLLKTRWLCKTDRKRVLLTMEPNAERTGVVFGVQADVPVVGNNAAQRREHDKRIGAGTMSRSGATCPCCGGIMTMEDIRLEGRVGRLAAIMTVVVVDGESGKEYRLPTPVEAQAAGVDGATVDWVFRDVPFGVPDDRIVEDAKRNTWCVQYGADEFRKLFTSRQLAALGVFAKQSLAARHAASLQDYPSAWVEAIAGNLACTFDKLVDHSSAICSWNVPNEQVRQVFTRFALSYSWDFVEVATTAERCGAFASMLESTVGGLQAFRRLVLPGLELPKVVKRSATTLPADEKFDVIVTDPPYYDAIGYSVLMDYFYVWLRRTLYGVSAEMDRAFSEPLAPKWDHTASDGELIDDASRFDGDKTRSKAAYEDGMGRAFLACHRVLQADGRLVIAFAHKQPDAWETLVSAIIRAGFVVDASWPIQTERTARTRSLSSAALSSSVWLVCRKRPETARPGWDNRVLEEMRERIAARLHDFWDAGIRGPDFVWAATGPALEAYSRYPVVKKANEPGETMSVSEFLRHVRRIVVDFVVGRVLSGNGNAGSVSGLDDVTTYYLLHRYDFGVGDAPVGACILYAVSCGLSDSSLAGQFDLLVRTGGQEPSEEGDETEGDEVEGDAAEGSGSKVKLKPWQQRKRPTLGYEAPGGRPVPLIDQVHRLMHLWKAGDLSEVNSYLDLRGLRRNALFNQLLQALIELSPAGSDERALLESISNHVGGLAAAAPVGQARLEEL